MNRDEIIMTFNVPPSLDDLSIMAKTILQSLPDELLEVSEGMAIRVEDFPDEAVQQDMELEDPYELLSLYRSGSQIAPGVVKKTANDDDVLVIFRRPLLDAWCETGDDINTLLRHVMIEEIAQNFEFSEDDIEEMTARAFQNAI